MNEAIEKPALVERLKAIVKVEKQIDELMKSTRECIQELAKEKQISKVKTEETGSQVRRLIKQVESELNTQMSYLSNVCVGSAHQGSTFASIQNSNLAKQANAIVHDEVKALIMEACEPDESINANDDTLNDISDNSLVPSTAMEE